MTPKEIILKLLDNAKMSQKAFAHRLGFESQGIVSNRLHRGGMTMRTFSQMLSVFGYEIVVRPVGKPEEEIVVTLEEK